jgi:hypothetical protein
VKGGFMVKRDLIDGESGLDGEWDLMVKEDLMMKGI